MREVCHWWSRPPGGFAILDDPIFNGLAIALIFGILVSTVLTLVVIPLLYYVLLAARARRAQPSPAQPLTAAAVAPAHR